MALLRTSFYVLYLSLAYVGGQSSADPNSLACDYASGLISYCGVYTPGFTKVKGFQSSAECLCYWNGWAPDIWDSHQRSCWSYSRTAYPAAATISDSQLTSAPCRDVGNILSFTRTVNRSTLLDPIVTEPGRLSCLAASLSRNSCERTTSGFRDLDFTDQASCVCYYGRLYKPYLWDDLYGSCVGYLATASPDAFVGISAPVQTTPCASAGDVRLHLAAATASPTFGRAPTATSIATTSSGWSLRFTLRSSWGSVSRNSLYFLRGYC